MCPFTVSAVTEWMSVVVTQCEDEFQDSGLLWWGHLLTPSLRTTHHSRRNIDGGLWAAQVTVGRAVMRRAGPLFNYTLLMIWFYEAYSAGAEEQSRV